MKRSNFVMFAAVSALVARLTVPAFALEPDYVCYFEDASGRVINLTNICSAGATEPAEPSVDVTEWAFDADGWLVGKIRNDTDRPATSVGIEYEIYNEAGDLIDSGSFYADTTDLAPGEETAFSYPPRRGDDGSSAVINAEWRWAD